MKKNWTKYLRGSVIIKLRGEHAENFLNYCIQNGIQLWDIKRKKKEELELNMFIEDALRIKKPLRRSNCTFEIVNKKGAPVLLKRMLSRSGFILGMIAFFVVVFLLSNMVWNIKISGAEPKTEHHLRQVIKDIGITKGKLLFLLPDPREIQHLVTEKMDEVTWVGVTLDGTTFQFKVVQKELPDAVESLSPQNLIAKKKAVIEKMFIEQGQPKVVRNQLVQKGDLLVSGTIGKDKNKRVIAAKGKIFGEVWYKTDTTIPLQTTYRTYTGEQQTKHYLSFWGSNLPIWGFKSIPYSNFELLEKVRSYRFLKWELPITYIQKKVLESEKVVLRYNEKEAVSIAKEMAVENLENRLDDEAKIKNGKILHQAIDNGKVNVSMYFKVVENIAKQQPIVGGD